MTWETRPGLCLWLIAGTLASAAIAGVVTALLII